MSMRNKSSRNSDNFDFDSYLEEKSNPEIGQENSQNQKSKKKPTNFFRNFSLIVAVALMTVLWYYDWNPREAVSSIFGSSEPEIVVIDAPLDGSVIVIPDETGTEGVVVIENQGQAQTLEGQIAGLEQAAVDFATSEELERLTEQSIAVALQAAFTALENLETIELDGLEGLESLEALEGLEGFEGFEIAINEAALEALENIDFSGFDIQVGSTNNASFDQYYREIGELRITQFEGESIRELHEAGIPISFLSKLNDAGLLDRLDAEEIIELFQED